MSCHPNSNPERYAVSSDYIKDIRDVLRCKYNSDLPVIFMLGSAGDVRPPSYDHSKDILVKIFKNPFYLLNLVRLGIPFRQFTDLENSKWRNLIKKKIENHISITPLHRHCLYSITKLDHDLPYSNEVNMDKLMLNSSLNINIIIFKLTNNTCIRFLNIAAELTTDFYKGLIKNLEKDMDIQHLIVNSCCGNVDSYITSTSEISRGGYEVNGFRKAFEFRQLIKPSQIVNKLTYLIKKTYTTY